MDSGAGLLVGGVLVLVIGVVLTADWEHPENYCPIYASTQETAADTLAFLKAYPQCLEFVEPTDPPEPQEGG